MHVPFHDGNLRSSTSDRGLAHLISSGYRQPQRPARLRSALGIEGIDVPDPTGDPDAPVGTGHHHLSPPFPLADVPQEMAGAQRSVLVEIMDYRRAAEQVQLIGILHDLYPQMIHVVLFRDERLFRMDAE